MNRLQQARANAGQTSREFFSRRHADGGFRRRKSQYSLLAQQLRWAAPIAIVMFIAIASYLLQLAEVASGPAAHPAPSTTNLTSFNRCMADHGTDGPASGASHGLLLAGGLER